MGPRGRIVGELPPDLRGRQFTLWELEPKIEARPAHPVGGWAGGGFDFLIEVRSVQGLCGSVPRKIPSLCDPACGGAAAPSGAQW
jgi:hypothetical protein